MRGIAVVTSMFLASAAYAQEEPHYAPAPAWVREHPIPDAKGVAEDKYLLIDRQEKLSGDGDEYYLRTAYLVRSQPGLSEAGDIAVNWNPEIDDLVIHRVAIVRDGETIDLLGKGQKFTVLRRETGLEQAMLSGALTASLLAEGLEVGDILDLAYTVRRKDPILAGRSTSVIYGLNMAAKRSILRQTWDQSEKFKWRMSRDLPKPKVRTVDGVTELLLDLEDPEPRMVPANAPLRFHRTGLVEASSFSAWEDVSRLMAPHYAAAAKLPPDGALAAEAHRIMAEHADEAARVRAALSLVQDRMRYVYIGMDAGNYIPAQAELSWSRKFGDCKGKTAVLLALLQEMGIAAKPALVLSDGGDGLDAYLPSLHAFDHVIVRAEVGGRTYWLDGTARDAGPLDRLDPPEFRWALPISAKGDALEAIARTPPAAPFMFVEAEMDARQGTTLPVPATISVRFRGRAAAAANLEMGALSAEQKKEMAKSFSERRSNEFTLDSLDTAFDETAGTFTLTMSGKARLRWEQTGKERRYLIDGGSTPELPIQSREDGPDKDLPIAVPPAWMHARVAIQLPESGKDYRLSGEKDVEKTLPGVTVRRTATLDNERLTTISDVKFTGGELNVADGEKSLTLLKDFTRSRLYLVAPDYEVGAAERKAIETSRPETFDDLIDRGNDFLNKGEHELAIAEYDAALKVEPDSALAVANRGIAKYWLKDLAGAAADFDLAEQRDPEEAVWMRGRGLIAIRQNRLEDAALAFSAALDIDPEDTFSLYRRAEALEQLGKVDGALADIDALMALGQDPIRMYGWKANILMENSRQGEALDMLNGLVEKHPADPAVRLLRSSALAAADRTAEAIADFDALIKMKPTVTAYLLRAELKETESLDAAIADVDAARLLNPDNDELLLRRAELLTKANRIEEALTEIGAALEQKPDDGPLLLGRANLKLKAGDALSAVKDVVAAKAVASTPLALNEICWWGATKDQALELALSACDAALKEAPDTPGFLDSRGLVLHRLGRDREALEAFDAALQRAPKQTASLYGRSLVKARLNDLAGSAADRAAAIALDKKIVEEFREYGLEAPSPGITGTTASGGPRSKN